jgi:hypothetical protein
MKTKKISASLMLASFFFIAACEKEKVEAIEDSVVAENVTDNRGGDRTVGYYHNEILDEIITKYRVVNTENMEDVYGDIKILSEGYVGGETFNYADYESYKSTYIPYSDLSMVEAEVRFENDLISETANRLFGARLITAAELSYYARFNDAFFASRDYANANTIVASYKSEIRNDRTLSAIQKSRLNTSFDIAEYSLFYWETESEKGILSAWPVIADNSEERRPKWITALLKIGADICGGAVGAGVGTAIGGPVGTVVGGLAGGSAASAGMFN